MEAGEEAEGGGDLAGDGVVWRLSRRRRVSWPRPPRTFQGSVMGTTLPPMQAVRPESFQEPAQEAVRVREVVLQGLGSLPG
ncbi:hypothetical protein PR202_ga27178 [Eleusine coracana subsp. coracana]|uniref:Uncharacterized protein n=1 Tax=Eleusine coracana subsp. coracana TaxID=191504 RepID=A0AAV5DFI0_ELECO|nr:hypothetical protein PR202_ga27178 [Eleusine coracana subsp. coracana]